MSPDHPRILRAASRSLRAGWAAGVLALAAAVALPFGSLPATALEPPPESPVVERPDDWPAPPGMGAEAAVLVEADTGQVLYERRADEPRAVASTIKVLTALSVLERLDLDDEVSAGPEVEDVPGSGVGLNPGDTWTVEQLIDALIARSGNEAAEALAVHVAGDVAAFTELMAADAAALGLDGLELSSPSGLDDDQRLSALDLATIARAALSDARLRPFLARERVELPGEGELPTRNELLERYDGATGVKTGFTAEAGNSLVASAERDGRELVAVVLGAGDDPARFEQAAALLDLGFDAYRRVELGGELSLAVAGGQVRLNVAPTSVTAPHGVDVALGWPSVVRPPASPVDVAIQVGGPEDGEPIGQLPSVLDESRGPEPDSQGGHLGRAVVDGVYAALRAGAAAERLS